MLLSVLVKEVNSLWIWVDVPGYQMIKCMLVSPHLGAMDSFWNGSNSGTALCAKILCVLEKLPLDSFNIINETFHSKNMSRTDIFHYHKTFKKKKKKKEAKSGRFWSEERSSTSITETNNQHTKDTAIKEDHRL